MTGTKKSSKGQIIKASAIMGGTSAVSMITGIIRSKVMAVLLGPEFIGLLGLLQSVLNTASTVAGMGLAVSGVRQIADARARGDEEYLALTRGALRRASAILGLLGAVLLMIFCKPISRLAVGNDGYAGAIMWIAFGVWVTTVSGTQTATLNGMRRLGDLARVYVIGAMGGTLLTVLAVWQCRENSIVVAVLSIPVIILITSWWLTRKIPALDVNLSWQAISKPLWDLFSLGFAFMTTSLIRTANQFVVRVIITRSFGITATGYFQAAWSISALYLGFILEAMGKDYYPRLAAVAKDHQAANEMVNEQAEVALLLAGPVILGMLTLTSQVVSVIYSRTFGETVGILQWHIIGDLFKVSSWPMGFILVAQGRSRLYFITELSWNVIFLGLIWAGLPVWSLKATGIAYFLTHAFYFCLLWIIVYRINHFRWRIKNLVLLVIMLGCAAIISWVRFLPGVLPMVLGLMLTAAMGGYSFTKIYPYLKGIHLPGKREM